MYRTSSSWSDRYCGSSKIDPLECHVCGRFLELCPTGPPGLWGSWFQPNAFHPAFWRLLCNCACSPCRRSVPRGSSAFCPRANGPRLENVNLKDWLSYMGLGGVISQLATNPPDMQIFGTKICCHQILAFRIGDGGDGQFENGSEFGTFGQKSTEDILAEIGIGTEHLGPQLRNKGLLVGTDRLQRHAGQTLGLVVLAALEDHGLKNGANHQNLANNNEYFSNKFWRNIHNFTWHKPGLLSAPPPPKVNFVCYNYTVSCYYYGKNLLWQHPYCQRKHR